MVLSTCGAAGLAGDAVIGAVSAQAEGLALGPPLGLGCKLVLSAVLVCAVVVSGLYVRLGPSVSQPFAGGVTGLAVPFGTTAGISWLR